MIYSFKASGDFRPTFVSQNIKDWLGYETRDYLESPDFWRRSVHPDDIERVESEFGLLFEHGRHTLEYRFLKKDGAYCWVSDELRLIYDRGGEPDEIVGSWSDITDRKAAEEAIAATRAHVEQLLASSPAVIYSFKASGDFRPTYVSQNIKDWLGYETRTISRARTSGETRCTRTILGGLKASSASCSSRAAIPSNIDF